MDNIFSVNSASFDVVTITNSLMVASESIVDFSLATYVSGTFRGDGYGLTRVSASYSDNSITASVSNSSSYLIPGATFYIVSGSDGLVSSYVEPYNYATGAYFPPFKEGRMWYDSQYHNMDYYTEDPGFRAQLCKELIIGVHNPYSVTLPRLSVVYVSGSTGDRPDIYLAQADGTGTKSKIVGVVRSDILSGSNGYMLTRGVMHRSNMSSYNVGTALWLSSTVPGELTSTRPGQPYEEVLVGYCAEGGSQGSFVCAIQEYPTPANAYAGMTSIPEITDNTSSFEVYVGSGSVNLFSNAAGLGIITQYSILPITFSVPASLTASFIYATSDGTTASYEITNDYTTINGTTKVVVATIYRADIDTHWLESKQEGAALANKLNNRLIATERFVRESGFTLYVTGSNHFVITAGSIWFGATKLSQEEFDSRNTSSTLPAYETHWAYHSASSWIVPTQSNGKYNNLYYDNGTNLVPLAQNSWSVNYFYRILGENPVDEDVFIVLGNYQYASFADVDADVTPSIPSVLGDVSLFVGRVIFQSGSETGTAQSAFTYTFGSSTVSQHNSLAGIQGGQGGEYYHLTQNEYNTLGISSSYANTASYSSTCSYAAGGDVSINPVSNDFNYQIVLSSVTQSSATTLLTSNRNTFYFNVANDSLTSRRITGSLYGTASQAYSASYWDSSSIVSVLNNKQWTITTGSFFPITASQSITASYALTADSALITGSTYYITSSWSISSSYAVSASWAPGGTGTSLVTGSTYPITSSWSINSLTASAYFGTASFAITASYAINAASSSIFTKGGTFFDGAGIAGPYTISQSIGIWRSPYSGQVTNVWGWRITGSGAWVNARKNGSGSLASGSAALGTIHIPLSSERRWISASQIVAASASFIAGDFFEIMMISSSGYPTQVAVQIDMIRT